MSAVSKEYKRLVLDDLKTYVGLSHPVRAGFWERLLTRRLPVKRMHPNPQDEFSDPQVGPGGEIINRYIAQWREDVNAGTRPDMDPLYVEKMSTGDYMLLDGHHRWFAASEMGIKTMPVRVLNVTPVDELLSRINASERRMSASFDLEEVLLTASKDECEKKPTMALGSGMNRGTRHGLRKNAPALINGLHELGFDVWVYSAGYMPEDALKKMLKYNGVTVDGIVNGMRNTQARAALHRAFSENYDVTVHIDNAGILCVETATKKYDMVEIGAGETDWGARSFTAVKTHPIVVEHLKLK